MADKDGNQPGQSAAAAAAAAIQPAGPALLSTEQVYDAIGPAYEDAYAGLPPLAASIKWLLTHLEQSPQSPSSSSSASSAATAAAAAASAQKQILDLGCGTGNPVASTLAAAGHAVLGLDISSAMIAAARARVPHANATFAQGDTRAFLRRARPASYDAVTVYLSLIHGVTQAEIRACIRLIFGVLRPGGLFVWATVPEDAENKLIDWNGHQYAVSSLPAPAAVQAVREAGFVVEHHAVTSFSPKAAEAGICTPEQEWEEEHLFVYARKPVDA